MEEAGGDGEWCPRCTGTLWSATKHGEDMTKEEYEAFEAEGDEEGRCPVCGQKAPEIVVGWPS